MSQLPLSTRLLLEFNQVPFEHLSLQLSMLVRVLSEAEFEQLYREIFFASPRQGRTSAWLLGVLKTGKSQVKGWRLGRNLAYLGLTELLLEVRNRPGVIAGAFERLNESPFAAIVLEALLSVSGEIPGLLGYLYPIKMEAAQRGDLATLQVLRARGYLHPGFELLDAASTAPVLDYLLSLYRDPGHRDNDLHIAILRELGDLSFYTVSRVDTSKLELLVSRLDESRTDIFEKLATSARQQRQQPQVVAVFERALANQ